MNLLIASILPVIILMIYFYSHDKFEKEPPKTLLKAFSAGVLSALLAIILAVSMSFPLPESASAAYAAFIHSFWEAAIPEEISKFALLFLFGFRRFFRRHAAYFGKRNDRGFRPAPLWNFHHIGVSPV